MLLSDEQNQVAFYDGVSFFSPIWYRAPEASSEHKENSLRVLYTSR
jgi:hypothetical protein